MVSIRFRIRRAAVALLWLGGAGSGLAACGGGDSGPVLPPPPAPDVRSVNVTPGTATLRVGETQGLSAVVDAINGAGTGVTWTSESPALATVSASGVVTGVAPGTAVIRATSTVKTQVSGTAVITVQPARGVSLTPPSAEIGVGRTVVLAVTVQLDPGLPTTVTWRTSAASVATVSQTGVVTGVALGSAQITVVSTADTTVRASATVNVVPSVRAVAVSPTTATLNINDTRQITATVTADAGVSQALSWRSSNPTIATVSATGLVTALAVGSSTITAVSTVDTLRRASATVTVAPRTTSVAIAQRAVSLNPSTSTTLTAVVTADPGVATALTWTSSAPSIATVSSQGVVNGVAVGQSLITVALQSNPAIRDTVTVAVLPRLAATWTANRLGGALYEDVLAVAPIDANTAYAVSSIGNVYRWNGTTWTLSATGASFNTAFAAVSASAANNVIAVGSGGVIARFNGTSWTAMPSGTTRSLYAVSVTQPTAAWAVGEGGVILQLGASGWSTEASGSTQVLNAVWAGDNVVYAVGDNGEVLRRSGATWTRVTVPTSEVLYGVHGVTATDIVIVGTEGTILQGNGTTWNVVSTAGFPGDVFGVVGSAAQNGRRYIVGDGGVAQLDGVTLTAVQTPYAPRMYGIAMDASGAVWAGGQRGAVLRSGTPWTTLNLAPDLLDVWSTAATHSLAVGEFGFVYRWNGSSWIRQTTPTQATLNTVWAASATDAFAGGDGGTMLRSNGTSWTAMSFPSTASVYALWGSSSTSVYAATDAGEVLRFNGTSWSVLSTVSSALWAVYGTSTTNIAIAGEDGLVRRFNGTTWTTLPAPVNGTLAGLWTTGTTDLFTAGANDDGSGGVAFSLTGASWTALSVGSTRVFTSIWGPSLADLYITGDVGTLLRFNGSTWSTIPTGTTDLLWAISAAPDATGAAFAVGYNSTIVAGTNGTALQANVTPSAARLAPGIGAALRRGALPDGAARARRIRR